MIQGSGKKSTVFYETQGCWIISKGSVINNFNNLISLFDVLDYSKEEYISKLLLDFVSYMSAARNLVLKTLYTVLICIFTMFILHITGHIVFHFLKTRHKFPVRRIYLSRLPPRDYEAKLAADSDSEEAGFEGGDNHVSPSRTQRAKKSSKTLSPSPSSGAAVYSETKV